MKSYGKIGPKKGIGRVLAHSASNWIEGEGCVSKGWDKSKEKKILQGISINI
jgi:hypothetical protein